MPIFTSKLRPGTATLTASTNADALVLEGTTEGMTIFSTDASSSSINFGDANDNAVGIIKYTHGSTNTLGLGANGAGDSLLLGPSHAATFRGKVDMKGAAGNRILATYQSGAAGLQIYSDMGTSGSPNLEAPWIQFRRNVNNSAGDFAATGAVPDNQDLGGIAFYGSDGDSWERGAFIKAKVDGTIGASSIPSELIFGIKNTEKLRIQGDGNAVFAGTVTASSFPSPTLTGTPAAPTASAATNTTQVATTAFVRTEVSNLVASAPADLDTLNELAYALGDDANHVTTITNLVGLKSPIASPTFTGTITIPNVANVETAIVANTAKTGITSGQTSAITANTAKTGITSGQTSAIVANTAKTGITSGQTSAITANTAKTGITSGQTSAITANTAKTGITSGQTSAITANTAKTGITSGQTSAITANTAKATDVDHNVSTALSTGTVDATSYGITSDGGADDVVIAQATTSAAGVLSAAKWDEIVANTLKVTDANHNVSTALSAGTISATTYGITSDGGADDIVLPEATTSAAGLLGAAKWDEIVANTLKVTDANHNVSTAISWTAGTTAGPTLVTDGNDVAIPSASGSASGVVTTGAQTFAGAKTFAGDINSSSNYIVNEQGRGNHVANTMSQPYYQFDGINDKIVQVSTTRHDYSNGITWRAIFKVAGTVGGHLYTDTHIGNTTTRGSGLRVEGTIGSTGYVRFSAVYASSGNTALNVPSAANSIKADIWYDVVATWDGTTSANAAKLYINGVLVNANTPTQTQAVMLSSNGVPTVGSDAIDSASWFTGSIALAQRWSIALTELEVKELYSGASVPFKYKGASQTLMNTVLADNYGVFDNFSGASNTGYTASNSSSSGTKFITLRLTGFTLTKGKYVALVINHSTFDNVTATWKIGETAGGGNSYTNSDNVGSGISTTPNLVIADSIADPFLRITYSTATNTSIVASGIKLFQIGAVVEYDGQGAGEYQWMDTSGNGLHANTSETAKIQNRAAILNVGGPLFFDLGQGYNNNSIKWANGQEIYYSGNGGLGIKAGTADLKFESNKFIFNSSTATFAGDVNIGVTGPSTAYMGDSSADDDAKVLVLGDTILKSSGTVPLILMGNGYSDDVNLQFYQMDNLRAWIKHIDSTHDQEFAVNAGDLIFKTHASGGTPTEKFRIADDGVATFADNILAKKTVGGADYQALNLHNLGDSNSANTVSMLFTHEDIPSAKIICGKEGSYGGANLRLSNLVFQTNNSSSTLTTALTINSSQNATFAGYITEQGRQDHVSNTMASPYYHFDGTNDFIATSAVTVGGLHTYSYWAKSDYNERQTIFGHGTNLKGSFYPWFTDGKPLLHFNSATFRYWVAQTKTYDGKWHHYAVVVDFSDVTACELYIDGVLIAVSSTAAGTYLAYSQGLTIGAYQNTSSGGSNLFQGDISNFKVYNIELSSTEVKELYSGASVPFKYKGASQTNQLTHTGWVGASTTQAGTGWTPDADADYSVASSGGHNDMPILTMIRKADTNVNTYTYPNMDGSSVPAQTLTPGKKYRASVWVKSGTVNVSAILNIYNASWGSYAEGQPDTITSTSSWQEISLEFIATGGTDGIFMLRSYLTVTDSTQLWSDPKIVPIGAVAEYDGSGATGTTWYDKSGNNLDGTVTGATLQNKVTALDVTDNATFAGSVHIDANNTFLTGRNHYNTDVVNLIGWSSASWCTIGHSGYGIKSATGNFQIDGSDNLSAVAGTFSGNVEVSKSSQPHLQIQQTSGNAWRWYTNGTDSFIRNATGGHNILSLSANGDVGFYDPNGASTPFFWDASTERLGIGNIAPEEKLHITDGKLKIDRSSGAGTGDVEIHFDRRHDAADARIIAKAGASGAYGTELHFVTTHASNGEATGLVIDDNQYVGIGTTSPASNLHVESGATRQILGVRAGPGEIAAFTESQGAIDSGHDAYILVGGYRHTNNSINISPLQLGWRNDATRVGYIKLNGGTDAIVLDASGNTTFAGNATLNTGHLYFTKANTIQYILKQGGEDLRIKNEGTSAGDNIVFEVNDGGTSHTMNQDGSTTFGGKITSGGDIALDGMLNIYQTSSGGDFHLEGIKIQRASVAGQYMRISQLGGGSHFVSVVEGGGAKGGFDFLGHNAETGTPTNYLNLAPTTGNATFAGEVLVNNKRTNMRLDSTQTAPNKLSTVLMIKGYDGGTGDKYSGIGFNYGSSGDVQPPAWIGIQGVSNAGHSKADIVFATRSVTTDTAPTERMRIDTDGNTTFAGTINSGAITSTGAISGTTGTFSGRIYADDGRIEFESMDGPGNGNFRLECGGYWGKTPRFMVYNSTAGEYQNAFEIQGDVSTDMNAVFKGGATFGGAVSSTTMTTSGSMFCGDNLHMTGGQLYINGSGTGAWRVSRHGSTTLSFGHNPAGTWLDNRFTITTDGNASFLGTISTGTGDSTFGGSESDSRIYISNRGSGDSGHFIRGDGAKFDFNAGQSTGYFSFGTNGGNSMKIAADGKVGIGTTSPNRMLTIEGDGNEPDISLIQLDNTNNNFNEIRFLSVGSDDSTRRQGAGIKGIYRTHSATSPTTDIAFETRNSSDSFAERMRITSDGNIGIGTTTPASRLDVFEDLTVAGVGGEAHMRVTDGRVGNSGNSYNLDRGARLGIGGHQGSGYAIYGAIDGRKYNSNNNDQRGYLTFSVQAHEGGSWNLYEKMRINNDGNIGIGTTSPDGKLHVHTASAGSWSPPAFGNDFVVEGSDDTGMSIVSPDANEAYITFGSPSRSGTYNAIIYSAYSGGNEFLAFNTYQGGEVMRLTHEGKVKTSKGMGVGIEPYGTTQFVVALNSEYPVHVGRADEGNCGLSINGREVAGAYQHIAFNNDGGPSGGSGESGAHMTSDIRSTVVNANNTETLKGKLEFKTNAGDSLLTALTLDNSQNATFAGSVGIGKSPDAKLNLSQAAGANIRFDNSTTSRYFTIGEGVGTNDKFSFRGNSYRSTDTLTVDFANSRVGVNNISPSYTLDVTGSLQCASGSGNLFKADGAGASQFYIGATGQVVHTSTTGNTAYILTQSGAGDALSVDGSAFIVKANGYVGIGTSSPSRRLDVESTDQWYADFNTTAANGAYISLQISGTDKGYLGSRRHLQADTSGYEDDLMLRAQGELVLTAGGSSSGMVMHTNRSATFKNDLTVNKDLDVLGTYEMDGTEIIDSSKRQTGMYTRQFLHFGYNALIDDEDEVDMNTIDGAQSEEGYVLPRAGWVTAMSVQGDDISIGSADTFKFKIYKNGSYLSNPYFVQIEEQENGRGTTVFATPAAFNTGDRIKVTCDSVVDSSGAMDDIAVLVEVTT